MLSGHKVRSFFDNFADPDNTDGFEDVTMDTHAVSLAVAKRVGASAPELAVFDSKWSSIESNTKGSYAFFAEAYRDVAHEFGMNPLQVQAITWLYWRAIGDDPRFPDVVGVNHKSKANQEKRKKRAAKAKEAKE